MFTVEDEYVETRFHFHMWVFADDDDDECIEKHKVFDYMMCLWALLHNFVHFVVLLRVGHNRVLFEKAN